MRAVTLSLALYLVVLAVLPCADAGARSLAHSDEVIVLDASDPPAAPHQDHCTPFCSCVCCGILLDAPVPFPLDVSQTSLFPQAPAVPHHAPEWKPRVANTALRQPPRA